MGKADERSVDFLEKKAWFKNGLKTSGNNPFFYEKMLPPFEPGPNSRYKL